MPLTTSFLSRPALSTGTMAAGVYQGTMCGGRKNTEALARNCRSVGLNPYIITVNNPKPSLIPLTGGFSSTGEMLQKLVPPTHFWSILSPHLTGLKDAEYYRAKRLKAVSIIVSGRQLRLRLPTVSAQVERPFVFSNFLRLVFHESINLMELIEKHGKVFGVLKNVRRRVGLGNHSKADSAGGSMPVSSRAHPSRFKKAWLDL